MSIVCQTELPETSPPVAWELPLHGAWFQVMDHHSDDGRSALPRSSMLKIEDRSRSSTSPNELLPAATVWSRVERSWRKTKWQNHRQWRGVSHVTMQYLGNYLADCVETLHACRHPPGNVSLCATVGGATARAHVQGNGCSISRERLDRSRSSLVYWWGLASRMACWSKRMVPVVHA